MLFGRKKSKEESENTQRVRSFECLVCRERYTYDLVPSVARCDCFAIHDKFAVLAIPRSCNSWKEPEYYTPLCECCFSKLLQWELSFLGKFVEVVSLESDSSRGISFDYVVELNSWVDLFRIVFTIGVTRVVFKSGGPFPCRWFDVVLGDGRCIRAFFENPKNRYFFAVPAVVGISALLFYRYDPLYDCVIEETYESTVIDLEELVEAPGICFTGNFERLVSHFDKASQIGLVGKISKHKYKLRRLSLKHLLFSREGEHIIELLYGNKR